MPAVRRERPSDLLRRALGPLRPAAERAYLGVAAQAAPRAARARLRGEGDPRAAALADAADAIRGLGVPPEEAGWAERIEAARRALAGTALETEAFSWGLPEPWGRFLLRLARRPGSASCVELGTGVGISAAYISAGLELAGGGRLITVERREQRGRAARDLLAGLGLTRAEVRVGDLRDVLDGVLDEAGPVDLVFVDSFKNAEHVAWCLERLEGRLGSEALVIVDDIHWSRRLASMWRRLRRDSRWALSADLWRLGALAEARPEAPARAYDPPP